MTHRHVRETLGKFDTLGPCPDCHASYVVVSRICRYCWASFRPTTNQTHCSKPCSARDAAWNAWMNATSYGRKGPKMPTAGASLSASVERFSVDQLALSA